MEDVSNFPSSLNAYIHNFHWNIPVTLMNLFPALRLIVTQVTLPAADKCDQLIWNHTNSGNLSSKDAYSFKRHRNNNLHWCGD